MPGNHFISRLPLLFLDLVYPRFCPLCGKKLPWDGGEGVCAACLEGFHPVPPPYCPRCGRPILGAAPQEGVLCGGCRRRPPPYRLCRSGGLYEGNLKRLICLWKYGKKEFLGLCLARWLEGLAPRLLDMESYNAVVPVPLHPLRKKERGFDQSLDAARLLGRRFGLPVSRRLLRRVRYTRPQASLGGRARVENVRGAFALRSGADCGGRRLLLFDDVLTTGETTAECARLLRRAAATVDILTLARGA